MYRRHGGAVHALARRILGSDTLADDVTQEVFLRAHQHLARLRAPEKFGAWVARMSRRLALNRLRDATRCAQRDTAWSTRGNAAIDVETAVTEREFHARLRGEIERLPDKLRSVLLLCAVEEMSTRAVAVRLRIPEGTVRSRLHEARKRLLEAFAS